jgi:hypothetical protein
MRARAFLVSGCSCVVASASLMRKRMGSLRRFALALGLLSLSPCTAFALDGTTSAPPEKIPSRGFTSAEQALRAGLDDLKAGDAASSIAPLTYAADSGQLLARWQLGCMYARGDGVAHNDLKAYHYFNQLVEDYDEDEAYRGTTGVVSNAFVAVGVYSLTGIQGSEIQPDPERARGLFQYAAGTFGDPDAEYNLARMYIDGTGGLARDNMLAARWLRLAAMKNHRQSQALLGHLLFLGRGLPRQAARGLMWLQVANESAQGPRDEWIRVLNKQDLDAATEGERAAAENLVSQRARGVLEIAPEFRGGWTFPPAPGPFRGFASPPPADGPWRLASPAR